MKNLFESGTAARFARPLSLVLVLALGGCAAVQETLSSIGARGEETPAKADAAAARTGRDGPAKLAEGVERYEAGDFVGAIRALNAPEISRSDVRTRVEAGKYLAFSYCVTNRRTLCRQSFDRVLRLDPGFRLAPAEAGHPQWGPVFVQARNAVK